MPLPASPWHDGEIAMQRSVGVAARMETQGRRVIRDHLIEQHRQFYPLLPFMVLGAVDPDGDVWATLRAGPRGFLQSPDRHSLHAALPRDPQDPADRGMEDGDAVALLGIELPTRRRNRVNGTLRRRNDDGFTIEVTQSFGNCNQYIQQRDVAFTRPPRALSDMPAILSDGLDESARRLIDQSDTFFVASYVDLPEGGRQVDVSHRGGKTGFVRIDGEGRLTVPDFAGNLFFNTIGNFLVNPKGGLVFPDVDRGDLLQVTGDVEVILDSPEIAAFQGAERLWRLTPRRVIRRPQALPLRWHFAAEGWSPKVLMTGDWQQAARRLAAATPCGSNCEERGFIV